MLDVLYVQGEKAVPGLWTSKSDALALTITAVTSRIGDIADLGRKTMDGCT